MTKGFIRLIVPERLRKRPGQWLVSRLLVQFIFLALSASLLHAVLYYIAASKILLSISFGVIAIFFALMFSFRIVSRVRYITYVLIATLFIAYTAQITLTGGIESPVIPQMIIIPMLALVYGVWKDLYILIFLYGMVILIFSVLSFFNVILPYEIPENYMGIFSLLNALFPFVAFISFIPLFRRNVVRSNQELKVAYNKVRSTSKRLLESEKLASIGQLTAGIAHEINNPVNFTLGSAQRLKADIQDFIDYENKRSRLLKKAEGALKSREIKDENKVLEGILNKNRDLQHQVQYDDLMSELNDLIDSVENGAARTAEIVKGLRTFSRMDDREFKLVNILDNIESTLILLRNEFKDRIVVKKKFDDLPLIECNPSKINQVLLNVINNAIHAIDGEGIINIFVTYNVGLQQVTIKVEDSGAGIPKSIESEVFNPFFTTKEVGRGTGLGLSVCKSIVEEHHGKLFFRSLPAVGTTFFIELPIAQPSELELKEEESDIL